MNCGKYSRVRLPGREDLYVEGPEYETTAMIGGSCGIHDIREVAYANRLCDDLGLDTMSGGSVAAFAMECFQRGIIGPVDVGGRELRFGNLEDLEHLLRLIARREGIGDVLARGTRGAGASPSSIAGPPNATRHPPVVCSTLSSRPMSCPA